MTSLTKEGAGLINPFVDWGFKYIFGREENEDLLRGFLNLLLKPEVPIREIQYLNPGVLPDKPDMKRCVFDVLCTDENGDRFLVEMQNTSRLDMNSRLVYYACRLIDRLGKRGQEWSYSDIRRVYAICLMNFTYEKNPSLRSDILLRSNDGRIFSDLLNIITLQIPALKAKTMAECRESYEKLLLLLSAMENNKKTTKELLEEIDSLESFPEELKDMFRRVVTTNEDELTEEQWADYERDLDFYQDTIIAIRTGRIEGHRQGLEEGRAAGLEEGRAEGLEEGRAEGLEEGRAEGRTQGLAEGRTQGRAEGEKEAKMMIARTMKENGAKADFIALCTGLSKDEIANI